jgi:site-specific DNA recombinase
MNTTTKYFLYARKSTDVEDKQVLSIDAQLSELRAFAEREQLAILNELIEKQSAKNPGRPIFNRMLDRIEAREAQGILAWHPDRLSRNGVDGGRIGHALDTGTLLSLKFPSFWFENTPQGKFMLNMAFSQSQYYVDALSVNTKRGLREKVRRGEYPGPAPMGYLNDYRTKRIIVDHKRAPLVKQMFEQYATGAVTLDTLRNFFATHNVRTKNGKLVGRSFVSHLLSNPLFYGHFRYAGEVYQGAHKPLISKKLFDEVQAVLNSRWKWSPKEVKPTPRAFLGLLRCAECGGAITAEYQQKHQKNGNIHKYTYYRCTKKNRIREWCTQPYIREAELDAELSNLLKPYSLPEDRAQAMLTRVKEEGRQSAESSLAMAAEKRAEIEKINLRLQRLLDSFLDGIVERDAYVAEKEKLMSQKKSLEEHCSALQAGSTAWLEPLRNWIIEAKNTGKIAVSGSLEDKRVLAQKVFGSNLVLDRKKARGCSIKPWSLLTQNPLGSQLVRIAGLEPARITPLPPQSSASANSAICARDC